MKNGALRKFLFGSKPKHTRKESIKNLENEPAYIPDAQERAAGMKPVTMDEYMEQATGVKIRDVKMSFENGETKNAKTIKTIFNAMNKTQRDEMFESVCAYLSSLHLMESQETVTETEALAEFAHTMFFLGESKNLKNQAG